MVSWRRTACEGFVRIQGQTFVRSPSVDPCQRQPAPDCSPERGPAPSNRPASRQRRCRSTPCRPLSAPSAVPKSRPLRQRTAPPAHPASVAAPQSAPRWRGWEPPHAARRRAWCRRLERGIRRSALHHFPPPLRPPPRCARRGRPWTKYSLSLMAAACPDGAAQGRSKCRWPGPQTHLYA